MLVGTPIFEVHIQQILLRSVRKLWAQNEAPWVAVKKKLKTWRWIDTDYLSSYDVSHLRKRKNHLQKRLGRWYVSFLEGIFWDMGPLIHVVLFLTMFVSFCFFVGWFLYIIFATGSGFELRKIKSRTCVFHDCYNWTRKVRRIVQNRINKI